MYSKLIPILPVSDVAKERAFYEALGFRLHLDPDETYPEDQFAALAFGENVLFGVTRSENAEALTERGLYWQIETTDIDAVHKRAVDGSLQILEGPTRQSWGRRTMALRSTSPASTPFEMTAQDVSMRFSAPQLQR